MNFIEIFFHALEKGSYECWLGRNQALPMIYVDDCIDATIKFLKADQSNLTRQVYNLAGVSIIPEDFNNEVKKLIPGLDVTYNPCPTRSGIADTWPRSLDDKASKGDWGWSYDITM